METVTRYKTVHRLLASMALCGGGAAAVARLSPGGLGRPGPLVVDGGASASVYRSVAGTAADAPGWAGSALEVAGEGSLMILGLVLVWLLWTAVRSGDTRTVAGSVVTGVATAAAYAVSEALKLVVDEERPCRAVPGAEPVAHCPELGDWSFPSNHAALAAGLAVGLAALRPRLALALLPLAGAAAPSGSPPRDERTGRCSPRPPQADDAERSTGRGTRKQQRRRPRQPRPPSSADRSVHAVDPTKVVDRPTLPKVQFGGGVGAVGWARVCFVGVWVSLLGGWWVGWPGGLRGEGWGVVVRG